MLILKSKSTHTYLIYICTIIYLHSIQMVAGYNPRVTCFYNKLLLSNRYGNFQLSLLRNSTISSYYSILAKNQNSGSGYGRTITPNISQIPYHHSAMTLFSCKNIIMNEQSCCPNQNFMTYSTNLNTLYNIILNNTKYPIVKYLNTMISNFDINMCNYNKAFLPSNDQLFLTLINNYSALIKKIQYDQRKFINQTLCLICLSTKDFPNFIYPQTNVSNMPMLNNLIYQREYFKNRSNYLTSILLQLQSLHNSMANYISRLATSVTSTSTNCMNIKNQALNTSYIAGMKMCMNETSCKKMVVQYFGQLVTPQLLYYINRVSNGLAMLKGSGKYVISQNPNFGFKGNVTYNSMYGNKYLPNVTIYSPDNLYIGLY